MNLLKASALALPGRLHPTDLALEGGQLTCLIGPNGSGKTSLLHAVAGIGAARGAVTIDGLDPRVLAPAQRQRLLSYLPAAREIKWPLLAADVLALGHAPDISARDAVAALELAPLLERRIDRLSTGERGRVLLARSLACDPRLLLLDEPIANLDPLWQIRVMDLLQGLARRGKAVLAAIHDLESARLHADRLIVMEGGRLVADGAPDRVLASADVERVFGVRRVEGGWRPLD